MEFLIIIIVLVIIYFVLRIMFDVNLKKIKKIAENDKLDKMVGKYPSNKEICEEILKKVKNENVEIEVDENSSATLYLINSNKIFIANLKQNFTRIQTIAHECLHSIQSKKLLWFNFVFSNIYIIFFLTVSVLAVFKLLEYKMLFICLLLIFGLTFYSVRAYLENDAMTKARFLAKEYMQEKNISSFEEIEEIINVYDRLNDVGIKATNFQLLSNVLLKVLILSIIFLIF